MAKQLNILAKNNHNWTGNALRSFPMTPSDRLDHNCWRMEGWFRQPVSVIAQYVTTIKLLLALPRSCHLFDQTSLEYIFSPCAGLHCLYYGVI